MKAHKHSKLFASNSGFTRVELSVVVVICIILGVMSSACSNSQQRQSVCISNLKQWGLVWQYYTDDNEGYFSNGSNSTTVGRRRMGRIVAEALAQAGHPAMPIGNIGAERSRP